MPAPRFVVAVGACAISGGPYASSTVLARGFLGREVPALLVPGCPPHPLTIIDGILDLLGIDVPAPGAAATLAPAGDPPLRSNFDARTIAARSAAALEQHTYLGCEPFGPLVRR
jgi:coenzyme F420-reducing hydrogenase gamma subunit